MLATGSVLNFLMVPVLFLWLIANPLISMGLSGLETTEPVDIYVYIGPIIPAYISYIWGFAYSFLYFISPFRFSTPLMVFVLSFYVPWTIFLTSLLTVLAGFALVDSDPGSLATAIFITIQAGMLITVTGRILPGAIRYVDPSWDGVAEGELLLPWTGLATEDDDAQEDLEQIDQEEPDQVDQEELFVFTI